MLTLISRWFEPVTVSRDYGRLEYVLLAVIVAAGALLRFWTLDSVGLHGDEDIMGLAARGILAHGTPILPSEMVYARAPLHTYLMAGTMYVLGDTEWAMRFPSALVGSFCGLFAFFMGKRFLEPRLNLAFTALITFLPSMIEVSQTARMYVFFVACLLIYGTLLFRWERTGRLSSLLLTFLALLLALQFQPLAILAAPLLLFPGLSRQSWAQLIQGTIAMLLAMVSFRIMHRLTAGNYPEESEYLPKPTDETLTPIDGLLGGPWLLVALAAGTALVLVAYFGLRGTRNQPPALHAVMILGAGIGACAALQYHIGAVLLLVGSMAWLRVRPRSFSGPVLVLAGVFVLAAIQLAILHGTGEFPGRRIIGALIGTPSIWPILNFAVFSPAGAVSYALILVLALWRFAQGKRLPVHFLFFAMSVWAPLLVIGFQDANPARRYMLGLLPFFLLSVLAAVSYWLSETDAGRHLSARPIAVNATCAVLVIVLLYGSGAGVVGMTHPVSMVRYASTYPADYPDHKGAAEFIKALNPDPDDLLIAEDSINQTFYLGKVDYRLLNIERARNHSIVVDGILRGQYTGTPIIGTGADLESMLDRTDIERQVYVIGSGENFKAGRRATMRGQGIEDVLDSERLEVIFEGRDGRTKVWRRR